MCVESSGIDTYSIRKPLGVCVGIWPFNFPATIPLWVLIKMLSSYSRHVYQSRKTLVTKFFGVHCVKPAGGQKIRFIVMGNLFHSEYRIHKRFDLKGSSYGRSIDKPEGEIDETTTLKDLDLNFVFHLQRSWHQELIRQVDRDCEFLEPEKIMDYSLLISLHFRDDYPNDEMSLSHTDRNSPRGYQALSAEPQDNDWIMEGQIMFILSQLIRYKSFKGSIKDI